MGVREFFRYFVLTLSLLGFSLFSIGLLKFSWQFMQKYSLNFEVKLMLLGFLLIILALIAAKLFAKD